METRIIEGNAMVGKNVAFTVRELTQMSEVLNKIEKVIENHQKDGEKKIYLDDNDLYRLEAIFMCVLESDFNIATTCFDRYEENMRKQRTDVKAIEKH